jgi:hypothetical protein
MWSFRSISIWFIYESTTTWRWRSLKHWKIWIRRSLLNSISHISIVTVRTLWSFWFKCTTIIINIWRSSFTLMLTFRRCCLLMNSTFYMIIFLDRIIHQPNTYSTSWTVLYHSFSLLKISYEIMSFLKWASLPTSWLATWISLYILETRLFIYFYWLFNIFTNTIMKFLNFTS